MNPCPRASRPTSKRPGATLWFRTYATPIASNIGLWDDNPPLPHPTHPHVRGWWPKSSIAVELPGAFAEFQCNPLEPQDPVQAGLMEDGECVEHDTVPLIPPGRGFGALSGPGHQYDLLNKGCYGANLEYIGSLKNTSTTNTETGYAYLAMVARNVSKFFGAAEVALPDPVAGDKRAVPALDPPSGNPARRELVDLLQARAGGRIAVGHGQTKPLKVRVASGGACATPVNLYLSKSLIERQPVGEPG